MKIFASFLVDRHFFCIIKRPAKIQTFKNRLEPNSDWKDQGPFELEIQSGPSKLEGPLTPLGKTKTAYKVDTVR